MNSTLENEQGIAPPKKGDRFQCESCGMAIQVTADCKCQDDQHVLFHCCGEQMKEQR